MKLEEVELKSLTPHPRNYKAHPEDEIEHLCKSLEENGLYKNIVISKDNVILAGHAVVQAHQKLGKKKIFACRLPISSDSARALKVVTADNEIAHLGEVDDRKLSELLKEIMDVDSLLGTGYDERMLQNLIFVSRPASEIADKKTAAEWAGTADFDDTPHVPFKMIVSFDSYEKLSLFCELLDLPVPEESKPVTSTWWPEKKNNPASKVKFELKK